VWKDFRRWEQLQSSQLTAEIEQKLAHQLHAAVQQCAYYRSLRIPTRNPSEPATQWLHRFPKLSRQTVRERFSDLIADSLRPAVSGPDALSPRQYNWAIVKTGGSTGIPTTVIHDRQGRDWGRATRLYSLQLAGFPLGTPYFRLWGSELDLLNKTASLQQRILSAIHAETLLNAFRARTTNLQAYYDTMRQRPDIQFLMAYVDAASGLAHHITENNLQALSIKKIMACAGTVTQDHRRELQHAFGAEVIDKYGSRECCDIASECSHHTGLHVFSPNVFLEIVDEENKPCPPGTTGNILVTLLNNPGFPMIRYEIGDLAAWAPSQTPCPCGSPFPRITSLQGRQDEMLTTEDGTKLTSVFVRHFVGVILNRHLIWEWQLEQIAQGHFVFRYIPTQRQGLTDNLQELKRSFLRAFGATSHVELHEVEEIPPTASGKHRWILNRCPVSPRA
jgi:phenylacetate-CoA ligase